MNESAHYLSWYSSLLFFSPGTDFVKRTHLLDCIKLSFWSTSHHISCQNWASPASTCQSIFSSAVPSGPIGIFRPVLSTNLLQIPGAPVILRSKKTLQQTTTQAQWVDFLLYPLSSGRELIMISPIARQLFPDRVLTPKTPETAAKTPNFHRQNLENFPGIWNFKHSP